MLVVICILAENALNFLLLWNCLLSLAPLLDEGCRWVNKELLVIGIAGYCNCLSKKIV